MQQGGPPHPSKTGKQPAQAIVLQLTGKAKFLPLSNHAPPPLRSAPLMPSLLHLANTNPSPPQTCPRHRRFSLMVRSRTLQAQSAPAPAIPNLSPMAVTSLQWAASGLLKHEGPLPLSFRICVLSLSPLSKVQHWTCSNQKCHSPRYSEPVSSGYHQSPRGSI